MINEKNALCCRKINPEFIRLIHPLWDYKPDKDRGISELPPMLKRQTTQQDND